MIARGGEGKPRWTALYRSGIAGRKKTEKLRILQADNKKCHDRSRNESGKGDSEKVWFR